MNKRPKIRKKKRWVSCIVCVDKRNIKQLVLFVHPHKKKIKLNVFKLNVKKNIIQCNIVPRTRFNSIVSSSTWNELKDINKWTKDSNNDDVDDEENKTKKKKNYNRRREHNVNANASNLAITSEWCIAVAQWQQQKNTN